MEEAREKSEEATKTSDELDKLDKLIYIRWHEFIQQPFRPVRQSKKIKQCPHPNLAVRG
jgi:hypothetical protein